MAISDDGKRGQIGPSLRGLIYQYERDGLWVTSKWPKKRGKVATTRQKQAQQAFKDCMLAMKMTAAPIQLFHRVAANGTPMLPRDTLMAALYGNGPTIPFYDGRVIKPMRNKVLASTVLDAMGWEPGTILFRGEEYWEPLAPGLDGQVLAYAEADKKPVWIEPPEGGGGAPYFITAPYDNRFGLYNITGNMYCAEQDLSLNAMTWVTSLYEGYDQRVGVFFVDDNYIVTEVPYPHRKVATATGYPIRLRHQFESPITIPARQRFVVHTAYDETYGPISTGLWQASSWLTNIPVWDRVTLVRQQWGVITPGMNCGAGSESQAAINLEFL